MIASTAQMRPGIVSPSTTGGSKKLSRLRNVPMKMPSGMLKTIATAKPTPTRLSVAPISVKSSPERMIAPTSAKVSQGFGIKVGGKKRLSSHQTKMSARIDAARSATSTNASRAAWRRRGFRAGAALSPVGTAFSRSAGVLSMEDIGFFRGSAHPMPRRKRSQRNHDARNRRQPAAPFIDFRAIYDKENLPLRVIFDHVEGRAVDSGAAIPAWDP